MSQTIEIAAQYLLVGMHIVYGTPEQRAAEPNRFAPMVITKISHRNTVKGLRVVVDIEREETLRSAGCDVDGTWTRQASQGFKATENVTVAIPDSPFVMDASNPTDVELAAAIERSIEAGTLITAEEFMAQVEADEDGDMTEAIAQAGPIVADLDLIDTTRVVEIVSAKAITWAATGSADQVAVWLGNCREVDRQAIRLAVRQVAAQGKALRVSFPSVQTFTLGYSFTLKSYAIA